MLDQIGRPDFIARDELLPLGYIEAEAYGRDLNNLTGHAATHRIHDLLKTLTTSFLPISLNFGCIPMDSSAQQQMLKIVVKI